MLGEEFHRSPVGERGAILVSAFAEFRREAMIHPFIIMQRDFRMVVQPLMHFDLGFLVDKAVFGWDMQH